MSFKANVTARFRDADPAGILFFASVFELAHDVFEDFVRTLGFSWEQWYNHPEVGTPVRQADARYIRPMHAGDSYDVEAKVNCIGDTSFTIEYTFTRDEETYCEVELTHVFVNKKDMAKIPIPEDIREKLSEDIG